MHNFLQRLKASIGGGGAFGGVARTNQFMVLINFPFGDIEPIIHFFRASSLEILGKNQVHFWV